MYSQDILFDGSRSRRFSRNIRLDSKSATHFLIISKEISFTKLNFIYFYITQYSAQFGYEQQLNIIISDLLMIGFILMFFMILPSVLVVLNATVLSISANFLLGFPKCFYPSWHHHSFFRGQLSNVTCQFQYCSGDFKKYGGYFFCLGLEITFFSSLALFVLELLFDVIELRLIIGKNWVWQVKNLQWYAYVKSKRQLLEQLWVRLTEWIVSTLLLNILKRSLNLSIAFRPYIYHTNSPIFFNISVLQILNQIVEINAADGRFLFY